MAGIPLLLLLTFPTITASNLSGEKITFPSGLRGERNLILVAFRREQQKDVDTWLAELPEIAASRPDFAYYEIPTIDRLNPVTRWFIDNGMRRGIPDKAQRARTVTLYIDKKPFKAALGIDDEDAIHALLIDRDGKVLWRAKGRMTAESGQELSKVLGEKK
jgi:hypothetical protein